MIHVTATEATARQVGDFLAIDPSIVSAGVAIYRGGKLYSADRIRDPLHTTGDTRTLGARCLRMAHEILAWCDRAKAQPRAVVFEWPQVYTAGKGKGSPNDLIALAGVGMAVAGAVAAALGLEQNQAIEVHTPTPADWTGQIAKTRTVAGASASPRAARIAGRLDVDEILALPRKSHDAIDAVGIGLWYLGRLEPVRVYPGAS